MEPAAVESRALSIAACLELGRRLDLERELRARVAVDPEEALVFRDLPLEVLAQRPGDLLFRARVACRVS